MIVVVVGRRGQGKTTLGYSIARKCDERVIEDVRHMVPAPDPVGDLPGDADRLLRQIKDPQITEIVVRPGKGMERTNELIAEECRALARAPSTGRLAILLDEASLIDFGPWDAFFRTASPDHVVLIVTAHQLQDVPVRVRALTDWFCFFRVTEPNALKMIEAQCGSRLVKILPRLGPRVFVRYDVGALDDRTQITTFANPQSWYVAMGSPQFAGGSGIELADGKPVEDTQRDLLS